MDKLADLPLRLTTKCIVKLGREGLHLHSPYGTTPPKLQFHELVTLFEVQSGDHTDPAELASIVAAKTDAPAAEIEQFVRALIRRGRLRRRSHAIRLTGLKPPKTPMGGELHDFGSDLIVVELPHDIVASHSRMLGAKGRGHWRDWPDVVPPLASFAPGRLVVNDVNGSVTALIGCEIGVSSSGVNWDMDSGIARARVDMKYNPSGLAAEDIIHVA
ncbi:MAG: hypothetical protein KDI17_03510 [Halioglobus sp.]|nr:hypothetical protein [Halioglobus sp.]